MKIVILPSARDDMAVGFRFTNASRQVRAVTFWNRFFLTLIPCVCMPVRSLPRRLWDEQGVCPWLVLSGGGQMFLTPSQACKGATEREAVES